MQFQYIPYLWLLGISLAILLFLAFFSLRYRKVTGSKAFGLCMLNFAFWTFANGLEMAGTDLSTKLFWANMQYFSYTTMNIFWLYMVLQFTGAKEWTRPSRILPLFIIPAIIILLVWTDQSHGLIRYDFALDYSGSFPVIEKSYGPFFWLHLIYGYTIVIIYILIIARAAFIHRSIYRMQAVALFVSPIISIIPNILYGLSMSPVKGFDITPVFLGLSGIIAAVGLFRYQLFAVIPVARDVAVDNFNIGMIVIDNNGIVVDANILAQEQLEKEKKAIIGLPLQEAMSVFGDVSEALWQGKNMEYKVFSKQKGSECYYEVQLLPIYNKLNTRTGSVILIRDVTEIRNAQLHILEQSRQLTISEERERLSRDLHDNLGQVMGFLNVQAQGIRNELKKAHVDIASDKVSELIEATQAAHRDIREYIQQSRFSALIEKDFGGALVREVEQFEKQTGISVILDISPKDTPETLYLNIKINILFILKEALNNIRKHSEAENVQISFTASEKELHLKVKDDGKGFDCLTVNKEESRKYGLAIMQERAEEIGAQLQIESVPGKGCTIILCLPLTEGDDKHVTESFAG